MKLKKIRQTIAIFVIIIFTIAFLGLDFLPDRLSGALAHLQLIPSILGILTGAGLFFAITFIIIMILTMLFGRFYCSHLCPLGIFQDLLAKLFYRRKNSSTFPWQRLFRKILFVFVLAFSAVGSLWLINILDPYSLFGKIFSNIFRPLFYRANNFIVNILQNFDIYSFPVLKYGPLTNFLFFLSLAGLILLVVSSFFQRRFFCTTLCPAGNFLALFSGHSLYKLQLNDQKCINCSACEKVCKTDCIDYKNNTIDNSECVTCFNCIAKCPTQAITFSKAKPIKKFQPNRRQVMKNTGLAAAFLLPLSLRKKIKPELTKNQPPVMPPGAKNIDHFTESCTACQLCAANCPTNVITPASFQYGLTGLFQPYMDFNFAYCEYDCNICVTICPSDALQQLNLETKQLTQMGTVELITDLCVVYKNDTDCGACAEACPTHAVYTEMENNINYPKTRTDICIGCGACQYMCPVSPKAIIVNANTEQILAEKPYDVQQGKGVQKPVDKSEEEFPF